jgi:hypothetical protein
MPRYSTGPLGQYEAPQSSPDSTPICQECGVHVENIGSSQETSSRCTVDKGNEMFDEADATLDQDGYKTAGDKGSLHDLFSMRPSGTYRPET